jgi:hypothetical protein
MLMLKMKTISILAIAGLVLALASASPGAVYTDDFSTAQDYTVSLAGTIWDGLKLTGGAGTLVACETTSNPGSLTFASTDTDDTNRVLLYKTVLPDTDFVMTVKMETGNWVPYTGYDDAYSSEAGFVTWHSAGLTAALDDDDWVANYYFSHPEWDSTFIGRSLVGGVVDNLNTDAGGDNIDTYPYTKLAREGNDFIRYYSADGTTWTEYSRHTRTDMAGVDLEIGLSQSMFTGNTGSAVFDEFSLTVVPEPATMSLLAIGGLGLLMKRRRRRA